MRTPWSLLLLILGTLDCSMSLPYYTIVAPKVVRPNSEYHVAISVFLTSEPCTTYVEMIGNLDSGETFNVSQIVTIEPQSTRIVKLDVGDALPGKYVLTASGFGAITFRNSTELRYVHKSLSIFIETDRAVYKPGSKVSFRGIVLNSRLRPLFDSITADMYIMDGQRNLIKQWKQRINSKGVFTGELHLANSPVLGDWRIHIDIRDQTFEKKFEVAEYVLPKFEVSIDTRQHPTFKDSQITATIRAKYTYGKPVKGEATITAYPDIFSGVIQPIFQPPIRKVMPIDGEVSVDFDIANELRLTVEYERPIQLEVIVEEALTGRRQNTSTQIILHKHKYEMDLLKTADCYKPGLKYTAYLKLAYHDGSPVRDTVNPVIIGYGFTYNHSLHTNVSRMLDEHGMIELDFYPEMDSENEAPLHIEAKYLNLHEWFPATNRAMSPSNTYIQAILRTDKPTVNRDIEIEVNSTAPLKTVNYEVFGRGDILNAATIKVNGTRTTRFSFLATYPMAPTARVVVYWVREDGEIIADSLNIELSGALQNFVKIQMKDEARPGEDVSFMVSSKPYSYVGILGVDQRSILLKSGNEIAHKHVVDELRSYDMEGEFSTGSSNWSPGSSSAFDVFKKSGAVIMTNGLIHENTPLRQLGNFGGRIEDVLPDASTLRPDLGPPVTHRLATRPPLAGPYAFSRIPTPVWNKPRVFPMHDISNTWLFANLSAGSDGRADFKQSVPSTINSWVLTGFAVDQVNGLGLMDVPRKFKVFQPFFISLDLPHSVMRGEIVAIPIVVFNYLDKDVSAEVVLENAGQFDFAEISNGIQSAPKLELFRKKRIDIKANSGASLSFLIIPNDLGLILIKVSARSQLAADSTEGKLLVKSEGETQYKNEALFVDLRNSRSFESKITITIPKNIVVGSEHIEVSAVGDILGPSIPNLDSLLKMPFGCGEQNMVNFVPNIIILNYLKNTNQLTQAVHTKALRYIETGYQQELTYRHTDGSFSAFGKSDASGSTWLTAFVAKSLNQAREYITVDDRIIKKALQWLTAHQADNGSFQEVGKISHQDMQGGASKGLALTAYTLIAFLDIEIYIGDFKNVINKGLDYIVGNLDGVTDVYTLSLCTYALNLAKHPYEDSTFPLLERLSKKTADYKWWSKAVSEDDKNPWHSLPSSVNIEMTSYNLLTYLNRNMVANSIPIMKWLVSQRNAEGGFASTQDTVIGIFALSKLAEKLSVKNNNVVVSFSYADDTQYTMNVNSANNMILQKYILPRKTRLINVTATGSGFVVIQASFRYNLNVTGAWPLFTLDPQTDKNSDAHHLQLSVCSGFVAANANESNMAVMEVSLPSGFTVDSDSLPSLEISEHVKRVETKNDDTVVILYFDNMIRQEYCPTISAFRTHKVAKQRPVPVILYDYYDSTRKARVFYEPREMVTLCNICENEDCGSACVSEADTANKQSQSVSMAAITHSHLSFVIILLLHYFSYEIIPVYHFCVKL